MALYSVKFKIISPMTHIPHSQTIFGTICHYYESIYGTKQLEKLLEISSNNKPLFWVSSMFPEHMLPFPQDFIPRKKNVNSQIDVQFIKKTKKIKYISKQVYNEYKQAPQAFWELYYRKLEEKNYLIQNNCLTLNNEWVPPYYIKDVRTRIDVDEELYYQDQLVYYEKDSIFEFYIECIEESIKVQLEAVLKTMRYVTFGGHKSIGYNMFDFVSIANADELKSASPRLLLSLSVGDKHIDYEHSYYQLKQLNMKFNNSFEAVNRSHTIVFTEGSILMTNRLYTGSLIKEKNNQQTTYQNMLGLLI